MPKISALTFGSNKQLFVDDHIIESRYQLEKTFHQPDRFAGNPIFIGEKPWEKWTVEVNGRPVVYDEESREFKMYYIAALHMPSAPKGILYQTCYAVSRDGIQWHRPSLRQVERDGSRENNIVGAGESWMRRANVIIDSSDPDRSRRYKMTFVDVIDGKSAIMRACSGDGIQWRIVGDPWFRRNHNSCLLGWDPRIQEYVLYPRMPDRPNSVGRSTSRDFVSWSEPELVLKPEAGEDKDFKGLAAFKYGDLYLAFLWVFLETISDVELCCSRDGINWRRPFPNRYFFSRGKQGSWDSEMILVVAPVVFEDKIWIYYTGQNIPYNVESLERVQKGWIERGVRNQRAIGMAHLRLDGFVSLHAGREPASLTTRSFIHPGGRLIVNADVAGRIRIELLNEGGHPIEGYTAEDCRTIEGDNLRHTMRWDNRDSSDELLGRMVKLRFHLEDAHLYAFQFIT